MERKSPGGTCWVARATRWALALCLLLAGSGMIAVGCDDKTEYRVLSFFFDGVPPPPGVTPPKRKPKPDPWGERAERAKSATRPASTQPAEAVATIYHAPYRQRQCSECHSRDFYFSVKVDTANVCRKCHQEHYLVERDDWIHGPVAVGTCTMCHEPHKSQYDNLLVKALPGLCFRCHNGSATLAAPYHVEAEAKGCPACHDPHSAGNRLLLVDAKSYRRRKPYTPEVGSAHSKWTREQCKHCHTLERSNIPVKGVNQQCLGCHKKIRKPPANGAYLHDPVRKAKCTSCHTAHHARLPHLLKTDGAGNCAPCHKMEEVLKKNPAHPPVHRAECTLCHRGHTAPGKHLLNDLGRAVQAVDTPRHQPPAAPTTRPTTRKAGPRP